MNRASPLLAALLLGFAMAPSHAQEQKPNTLSPQEIAEGWILLFDGETMFGWAPRGEAQWTVDSGAIVSRAGGGTGMLATTTEFASFELRADFWVDEKANSGVFLRSPASGEIGATNAYEVNICDTHPNWPTGSISEVCRVTDRPKTAGKWNSFRITADGAHLVARLNSETTADARDSKLARGVLALQQYKGMGEVKFRNLKLRPLGLESFFNSKDLAGWKEIPGRKSVYSVTPEGWLNVKNGNGDLQSERAFGDFVFQLEIISNGAHLNSGVFFRAEAGKFWSGYESQIRNQWEGDDRAKPVDFGTGGIYNQQRARRVVSSDREWFSKTIVAHGKHFAVWVNGWQVSDWSDSRPANDNARAGYRSKPGVLSLQGHDPTTDLSFRNLRIAEMPPARP